MAYNDLRYFPTTKKPNVVLDPTEFSGKDRVTEDTSILIQHTADKVCTTCDFSDMCSGNGAGGIYVECQNPQAPYGTHPHNALLGCDKHSE